MCKRLGPVRVRRSKYPLLLLNRYSEDRYVATETNYVLTTKLATFSQPDLFEGFTCETRTLRTGKSNVDGGEQM